MSIHQEAHDAARERLRLAEMVMDAEFERAAAGDVDYDGLDVGALAGPYCGCEDCIIREVLDAARPYFAALAVAEGQLIAAHRQGIDLYPRPPR